MLLFHDPHCAEYSSPGHPERPARITTTVPRLKDRHPTWQWREPRTAANEQLLRAHSAEHIARVKNPAGDFDLDTPAYPKIYDYALKSAGAGIDVARAALDRKRAFALIRPPGHHATRDRAMGFCYFSNIAIAALDALEQGAERVAIWDFDAHHGNGTEAIVANNDRIRFASIHQFPAYPGTGGESFANIDNYPVAPQTSRETHVDVCKHALNKLIAFRPNLILVSAGFDAYARDPLVQMTLEAEDFAAFGEWLRKIDSPSPSSGVASIPVGAILEGGYSDDLPELIDVFLTSWAGD
jgi:acetoin utilization deacetylase AcuC-like enzyme